MRKVVIVSIFTSSLIVAGGYKIPEQSLNSMALGGAYVAHTTGADSAYFNPANMVFLNLDKNIMEAGLTLVHLNENRFRGKQALSPTNIYDANGTSEVENKTIPYFHYISNPIGNFRWGMSLTVPAGLKKRWLVHPNRYTINTNEFENAYQELFAKEFTLRVTEFNPALSYKIFDNLSIGGGVRLIYSEGEVYNNGNYVNLPIRREMQGNTIEYGYNLATTYRPLPDINLAMTYRSNVNLNEKADSKDTNLYIGNLGKQYSANVNIPLPASLDFAISKTWLDRFTLEFDYERTYWSKYKSLDFNYGSKIPSALVEPFDNPKIKNWKDTDTFRLGATIKMDNITYMLAYAKDETPIPKEYISYELPDSDANIYSMGVRIDINDALSWGVAYLHDEKDTTTLKAGENKNGIIGKFSKGGADLITTSFSYKF